MTRAQRHHRREARRPRMIAQTEVFSLGAALLSLVVYAALTEPGAAAQSQPGMFMVAVWLIASLAIGCAMVAAASLYEACV